MMWLLKLLFDQNSTMINHKTNGDFNNDIIFEGIQEELVALFSCTYLIYH